MTTSQPARLVRPKQGRVIAGVAAGLADRFGMERGTMRLLFILYLQSMLDPAKKSVSFFELSRILVWQNFQLRQPSDCL